MTRQVSHNPSFDRRVFSFVREQADTLIEKDGTVEYPLLTPQLAEAFLTAHPQLVRAHMLDMLSTMMYDELIRWGNARRKGGHTIVLQHGIADPDVLEKQRRSFEARWGSWVESYRPEKRMIRLKCMTRPQLREAARMRRLQARTLSIRACFLENIAEKLPDDDTPVESVLSDSELTLLYNHCSEMYGGTGVPDEQEELEIGTTETADEASDTVSTTG